MNQNVPSIIRESGMPSIANATLRCAKKARKTIQKIKIAKNWSQFAQHEIAC
jgi:hypothetical protein